ncbi:MAG: YkvA family protein, partial [Candidatus Neomarinimicrobiota bacterium]
LTKFDDETLIINRVHVKMKAMISRNGLTEFEAELVADLTKIVNILRQFPDLKDDLKRRIFFALNYFISENDEIPDNIPVMGLLDDFVVVRWTLDTILADAGTPSII